MQMREKKNREDGPILEMENRDMCIDREKWVAGIGKGKIAAEVDSASVDMWLSD